MPVTPFHFGPGVLLKACVPRSLSLTAFVATQIVVDVESGYHLFRGDWPIHREAHSLLISGLLGLATGLLVWLVTRHRVPLAERLMQSEIAPSPVLYGGLAGGLTHPLLDAVMHPDLHPFWPVSMANPFLDTIGFVALHLGCVASGLVGAAVLLFRNSRLRPG